MKFYIISGLSGSGKTLAVKCFEDLGYFCVDNLPVELVPKFRTLCHRAKQSVDKAALVIDIRERAFFENFRSMAQQLKRGRDQVELIFFEASDEVLTRRFDESRRPHPLSAESSLQEAIEKERKLLQPIRDIADMIIDTSQHNVHGLKAFLTEHFGEHPGDNQMTVSAVSFGYRYGVPPDIDLLFDVRFMENPFFVPELKQKSGRDPEVMQFLEKDEEFQHFCARLFDFLDYLFPRYQEEGRVYLNIGIGCTGGRHRSVAVVEKLRELLSVERIRLIVLHRDIHKE